MGSGQLPGTPEKIGGSEVGRGNLRYTGIQGGGGGGGGVIYP